MCTALFWFRLISEALRAAGVVVSTASTVHHAHQYAESNSKEIAPFYRPIIETDFTGGSRSEHRWMRKIRSLDYPRIWYCWWRAWGSTGCVLGSKKPRVRSLLSAPQCCSVVLQGLPWAKAETGKPRRSGTSGANCEWPTITQKWIVLTQKWFWSWPNPSPIRAAFPLGC